jgi:hypothetical protein
MLFPASLLENTVQRSRRNVESGIACDGNSRTQFLWMNELPVTPFLAIQLPSLFVETLQNFPDFHLHTLLFKTSMSILRKNSRYEQRYYQNAC